MKQELEGYIGARVSAAAGRRKGTPSRRKQPCTEGEERLCVARDVQRELGEPQIFEKVPHRALKLAVGRVANVRAMKDRIVDACYREHRGRLQTEASITDWDSWIARYKAHAFVQARSGIEGITRDEALRFYRKRILKQINMLG